MRTKRQILKKVWGFRGEVMTLNEALPCLVDGRHKVAMPIWFGEGEDEPLPGGLDWISLIGTGNGIFKINRMIEPGKRERIEDHSPDELVVVFKYSEAKEKP